LEGCPWTNPFPPLHCQHLTYNIKTRTDVCRSLTQCVIQGSNPSIQVLDLLNSDII